MDHPMWNQIRKKTWNAPISDGLLSLTGNAPSAQAKRTPPNPEWLQALKSTALPPLSIGERVRLADTLLNQAMQSHGLPTLPGTTKPA